MLIKWSRGKAPDHVARHFGLSEFECKCGKCIDQMIDSELLDRLDRLRDTIGGAIIIHSGFRCADHNAAVGGETDSRHMSGLAADIFAPSISIEELQKLVEPLFQRIGVASTFIHVDVDKGKAFWTYPIGGKNG